MSMDMKTSSNMILIYLEGLQDRQLVPGLQLITCCRRNVKLLTLQVKFNQKQHSW